MRLLLLINRFPPHHGGGYELRFQDLAGRLRERGHRVAVVTSTVGVDRVTVESPDLYRILTFTRRVRGARGIAAFVASTHGDVGRFRRVLRRERPDAILIGNFYGLSAGLWPTLRESDAPLVLDVSNDWLVDLVRTHGGWFRIWEKPSRRLAGRIAKRMVGLGLEIGTGLRTRWPGLGATRIYATAGHLVERLREAGVPGATTAEICPSGIELGAFPYEMRNRAVERLLYVGRLKKTKAPHTAIEALRDLPEAMHLTVVGLEDDAAYAARLRRLVEDPRIKNRVEFRPAVPRHRLAEVFGEHDALVFPSAWAEPFSRLPLEAMASGLPVVATPNGGTADVVRQGENGLLFPAEDPVRLAEAIRTLASDATLRARIVGRARKDVEERYRLEAAVDRIERVLADAAAEGGDAP